ncbi:exodeoxyribonuclease V subunit beta [Blattabacterium sp. (Blaberus giganteus)]|uniref:UvrD-helicase domain-containing protein n=1 Tax=Blattabacterium sp. (Blaberus giganteus) TaxID=1186051 RepID=UPI00025F6E9C|nr:UvrD-helicase domain-containing protein [Blattabacterium sp. (Blaberus giganteus)]AFJ90612.1 ATP-dependent DNA helicase [Blattabacterium sp. (Blaberus giganteus)]
MLVTPSTLKIYNASAGSGKTTFLVINYLYVLLKSSYPDEFKRILALTFTRKASEEMKNRILQCIKEFSNKKVKKEYRFLFDYITKNLSLTKDQLYQRSKKILFAILHDFYFFSRNISTIDKFTYHIIRSFFSEREINLEMDTDRFLLKIVENILYRLKNSEKWSNILIQSSLEKLKKGKNWDLKKELLKIAHIMVEENNFFYIEKIKNYSLEDFMRLKNILIKRTKIFEKKCKKKGENFFQLLEKISIQKHSFIHLDLPRCFQKLINGNIFSNPFNERLEKYIQKGIFYSNFFSDKNQKILIEKNKEKILFLYKKTKSIYKKNISNYLLDKLFLKNINILSVIHEIEKEFHYIKKEKKIILNTELNKILYERIVQETYPKIYEKIGMQYKHYFIDEFQDISFLQWQNIRMLIENALSENGSAMIVGDPKQSIYRWRGGDAKQFIKLIYFKSKNYKKQIQTIEKNFRSYEEIVKFNNLLYQSISKTFNSTIYQDIYKNYKQKIDKKKYGGYVEINFIHDYFNQNYKEHIYSSIKNKIEKLLKQKYALSDIAILVRNNEEGHFLSEKLVEDGIHVNTSISLLIKNHLEIQIIINFLNIIAYPHCYQKRVILIFLLLKKRFFRTQTKINDHDFIIKILFLPLDLFLKKIILKNSLTLNKLYNKSIYNISEDVIEVFGLLNKQNSTYIYSFLDFVYRSMKRVGNSIIDFLDDWELKKEKESIVISDHINAIRIMTIHKSKGLQFPVVLIPFTDWNIYSKNKEETWIDVNPHLYNGLNTIYLEIETYLKHMKYDNNIRNFYEYHLSDIKFDNINLLYVATTRSIEQLILFSKLGNDQSVSFYIKNFLCEKKMWNKKKCKYLFGIEKKSS